MADIYEKYFNKDKKRIAVLLDPDKLTAEEAPFIAEKIEKSPADFIMVGGSLVSSSVTDTVAAIKTATQKPVILFPGSGNQLCNNADALLLLSLVSGRNPEYLIGEHVKSAYQIHKSGIEVISTAYILIDGDTYRRWFGNFRAIREQHDADTREQGGSCSGDSPCWRTDWYEKHLPRSRQRCQTSRAARHNTRRGVGVQVVDNGGRRNEINVGHRKGVLCGRGHRRCGYGF